MVLEVTTPPIVPLPFVCPLRVNLLRSYLNRVYHLPLGRWYGGGHLLHEPNLHRGHHSPFVRLLLRAEALRQDFETIETTVSGLNFDADLSASFCLFSSLSHYNFNNTN